MNHICSCHHLNMKWMSYDAIKPVHDPKSYGRPCCGIDNSTENNALDSLTFYDIIRLLIDDVDRKPDSILISTLQPHNLFLIIAHLMPTTKNSWKFIQSSVPFHSTNGNSQRMSLSRTEVFFYFSFYRPSRPNFSNIEKKEFCLLYFLRFMPISTSKSRLS